MLHSTLDQHHRGTEREDHGRCGRGRWPGIPGEVLVLVAARQSELPWDHGIHEHPPHRAQGPCRQPCGFLQPYRPAGGGMLAPATARVHRAMWLLRRLEQRGIRPPLWPDRGREDRPAGRLLAGPQALWGHPQASAALALQCRRLRRTASPRPLLRAIARCDLRGQARRTPRPWRAPTPPLATPGVRCHGRLRLGSPGTPPRGHGPDGLWDPASFLRWGGRRRHRRLVGPRAGVHDQPAALGHVEAPVRVLHGDATDDTVPLPAARWLLPGPTRFVAHEGPAAGRLAPGLSRRAHRTRARPPRAQPHALLSPPPSGR